MKGVGKCAIDRPAGTKKEQNQEGVEGGEGGAPGAEAGVPLHPLEKTMVRQVVPLQPEGSVPEQECRVQPTELTAEQVCWQHLWAMGDPCWRSLFLEDCTLWKGSMLDGESHQESEDEEVAEMKQCGLTTTPIPHPPVPLWERGQKSRREIKPKKKGELGRRWFQFCSCYLLSNSIIK